MPRALTVKAGPQPQPQPQPPLPAAARLLNVPHHPVTMQAWAAVAAPCQTGRPAVPVPVTAATTRGPVMKVMGCMMVST